MSEWAMPVREYNAKLVVPGASMTNICTMKRTSTQQMIETDGLVAGAVGVLFGVEEVACAKLYADKAPTRLYRSWSHAALYYTLTCGSIFIISPDPIYNFVYGGDLGLLHVQAAVFDSMI
ncbi:hypothetical protein BDR06DRAFT_1000722 [Suillus hirtellus]|nr:hypothetical protein BDR06DRAFT_1000722 [Suillus hirtellus]